MKKAIYSIFVIALILPSLSIAYENSNSERGVSSSPSERVYNYGLKQRDKAWNYAQKAKKLEAGKKKQKLVEKSKKSYAKAIKSYRKAIELNAEMYQAYSSLGFALRKTGSLDESLAAYKKALSINPDYYEAIEYLAETRLQRHEFEEVKIAYARLEKEHPESAQKLKQAISEWLSEQNVQAAEVKEFSEWYKAIT